jgi:hypothetical protein
LPQQLFGSRAVAAERRGVDEHLGHPSNMRREAYSSIYIAVGQHFAAPPVLGRCVRPWALDSLET